MNYENIQIYLDGPTLEEMKKFSDNKISGYTFNPTLFRNLGVDNYLNHSKIIQSTSGNKPISLEVIGDSFDEMVLQAEKLFSLGTNVYVKIPITYTNGESTLDVMKYLVSKNINLNITAIFTIEQIKHILPVLEHSASIISVFAGRIFDIGIDANKIMKDASTYIHDNSNCKILWASPRMHYDVISASNANCDIITMQASMYNKMSLIGKSPTDYSLETVSMFFQDAKSSGYKL